MGNTGTESGEWSKVWTPESQDKTSPDFTAPLSDEVAPLARPRRGFRRSPWFSVGVGVAIDLILLAAAARSPTARRRRRLVAAMAAVAGVTVLDVFTGHQLRRRAARGADVTARKPVTIVRAITIKRSPEEIYEFWQRLENLPRFSAGRVRLSPAPGGRGTEIHVEIDAPAPAGAFGATVGKLLGKIPGVQLEKELRRLKQVMETGEAVVASAGDLR